MGYPLSDITVYYDGTIIKDAPKDWEFRNLVNYVSDFYHDQLDKYKPPKTSRICIHLNSANTCKEPIFFGSICSLYQIIDERSYLSLNKQEKFEYILKLIHDSVIKASKILNWETDVFKTAYDNVLNSNFRFRKNYVDKKSRNRKNIGKVFITKTETTASLGFKITTENQDLEEVVLTKKNSWWYDSTYDIAKKCKWISNDQFGYMSKEKDKYAYLELNTGKIVSNIEFKERDI